MQNKIRNNKNNIKLIPNIYDKSCYYVRYPDYKISQIFDNKIEAREAKEENKLLFN